MTLSDHQWEFLKDVARLVDYAMSQSGYKLTGGDLYRSEAEQERMVRTGKSRTLLSKHRQRLAIDLNLFINGEIQWGSEAHRPLGEHWKLLSPLNVWGGDWQGFPDGGHYERDVG